MDPNVPNSTARYAHDGAKGDPTPIKPGDPVWDSVISRALEELRNDLNGTARGGRVFELVVHAWKVGSPIESNKEIATALQWRVGDVAEGFRLVRDKLKGFVNPVVAFQLREYWRDLVITPRGAMAASGDLLLAVGCGSPEVAGRLMAGATPMAKAHGMRVICEQPDDVKEQARVLEAGEYAGYLILPVDETDDFGAIARLGGRVALLDIATREGDLPCVSFDYKEAGLYCTQQLREVGCTDVVLIARENDSRTYAIGEGYRLAIRRGDGRIQRMLTSDGPAADTFWCLEQRELLGVKGRKLGILCADGALGEEMLRHLDSLAAGAWEIAVAVIGGKRWGARHWAELIWAELDYAKLAEEGVKYLTGASGNVIPKVKPRYENWVPRKPAGIAGEEYWRPAMAG